MASLTEILILRGVVPIENLDSISGAWGEDEGAVKALVDGWGHADARRIPERIVCVKIARPDVHAVRYPKKERMGKMHAGVGEYSNRTPYGR